MKWKDWKKTIRQTLEAAGIDLENDDIAFIDVAANEEYIVTRDDGMIGVTTADDE